jgi:hypothetical protein
MDDRGRDGETNFTLRIKEQETGLTLHEHVKMMLLMMIMILNVWAQRRISHAIVRMKIYQPRRLQRTYLLHNEQSFLRS